MWIKALVFLLVVVGSVGCALVPPKKIPLDRRNYLDAVSTSWKEQLLSNLVKLRYGDTLNFLEMTSINTSYSLDVAGGARFSRTWNNPFWHSLGVGGSVLLSDRPTISYAPLKGEALTKTVMMPLPVSAILRSLQTGWRAGFIFPCCIESINGLRNRSPSGLFQGDPAFFALAHHFAILTRYGVIRITIDQVTEKTEKMIAGKGDKQGETDKTKQEKPEMTIAYILIDKSPLERTKDPGERQKLQKALDFFYNFLDLAPASKRFKVVDGNREPRLWTQKSNLLVLQTRSLLESLNMLSEFIEIPQVHMNEKRVHLKKIKDIEWLNCMAGNVDGKNQDFFIGDNYRYKLRILSSIKPPANSFVAVRYRDYWYYIEDADLGSKFIFSSVVGIFSMSEPSTKEAAPVLTLPVQ